MSDDPRFDHFRKYLIYTSIVATFGFLNEASADRADRDRAVTVSDLLVGATILVVDNEESNRRLLEMMVGGHGGAKVHTLADPRQTVRECRRLSPNLLMLDLHMPQMDGVEVIAAVREQLLDMEFLPIIVLTADITSGAKERALAAGANDYLSKPFDHTEVLLRVNNLLETGSHFAAVQIRNRSIQSRLDSHVAQEVADEEVQRRQVERIRLAFQRDHLRMVFQPITDLSESRAVGVEALARFDIAPYRSPDKWFAEAADIGEGVELEIHAITAAVDQISELETNQFMTLNTSPMTAASTHLRDSLAGLPPERIVLELTEHVEFDDYPELMAALDEFRSEGIRIAVDDAGSGYSGLKHLLMVRPDIIKLDQHLICGRHQDSAQRAIVTGLLSVAEEMDATIVAEGIETAEDLEALRSLGVPWGQGYHIARPGPLPQLVC